MLDDGHTPDHRGRTLRRLRALIFLSTALAACGGPGSVEFTAGQCRIQGVVASLAEVEARQAIVTQRILSRQPALTLIAVLVVLLAGASYLQKLVQLFAARKKVPTGLGARFLSTMERYREHPVRYFSILGGVLALIALAGGAYIYFDADKRASERALANLQFCHLALRTADEQSVLSAQRTNLEAIQTTAVDIRGLVDKLPPEEQTKAREIIAQFQSGLDHQGRLVAQYARRADDSVQAVRANQEIVVRGLASLDSDVASLKALPGQVQALGQQLQRADAKADALALALGACTTRMDALAKGVDTLTSRPEPTCPACVCAPATTPSSAPALTATSNGARGPTTAPAAPLARSAPVPPMTP